MQCELNPKIPYREFSTIMKKQKMVMAAYMYMLALQSPLSLFSLLHTCLYMLANFPCCLYLHLLHTSVINQYLHTTDRPCLDVCSAVAVEY